MGLVVAIGLDKGLEFVGLCQKWTGLWHLILIVLLIKSLRSRRSYLLVNLLYKWDWSQGLTLKTLVILWVVDHQCRCR